MRTVIFEMYEGRKGLYKYVYDDVGHDYSKQEEYEYVKGQGWLHTQYANQMVYSMLSGERQGYREYAEADMTDELFETLCKKYYG